MKTVLITGASSDIGRALCQKYLETGHKVYAHYNSSRVELSEIAGAFNSQSALLRGDFQNVESLHGFLLENRKILDEIDVFIHAVGLLKGVPFDRLSADDLMGAFCANTLSSILITQSITPGMRKRLFGRVVLLSSVGVKFRGGSGSYAYALSKHSLEYFPADFKKWAKDNVFINAIRIGVTDTRIHQNDKTKNMEDRIKMIPVGRMAKIEEIRDEVFRLASFQNTFITGEVINVTGGE